MNTPAPRAAGTPPRTASTPGTLSHLDWLESEAIHILREVAGQCAHPALLFSGGKDSIVLLHLATKAFGPARFPFPLLHVDTGHNFPEVIEFRDRRAAELGERLIVRTIDESIARGRIVLRSADESRNKHQSVTLLDAIAEFGFDACIGGARRDEEKARAKERVFSFRDGWGQWDPKNQRPELWDLYNARVAKGEHMRVFPISNWTETDVWEYIAREGLEVPSLYLRAPAPGRAAQWRAGARDAIDAAAARGNGRADQRALSHGRRHLLHLPRAIDRGRLRADHPRDRRRHAYRARRNAHGRPDVGGVHGTTQARRIFLTWLPFKSRPGRMLHGPRGPRRPRRAAVPDLRQRR